MHESVVYIVSCRVASPKTFLAGAQLKKCKLGNSPAASAARKVEEAVDEDTR